MKHRLLGMALMAIGCIGTATAAEKIRYEELPNHTEPLGRVAGGRRATVITGDGAKHVGRTFRIEPDRMVLYVGNGSIEDILSTDIVRIEVKTRRRHFLDFTVNSILSAVYAPVIVCGGDLVCAALAATVISPVSLAVAAVSAPVTLTATGIQLLIPPKVWEIVH